jgi:hypothetical protein
VAVERFEDTDGDREDERRTPLQADFRHGLQIPELQRHRLLGYKGRGILQLLGCLKFSIGMDDLGPLFAFSFRCLAIDRRIS